jgi:vacuolar-type H+-ATPase subunit E/Vma4
MIIDIDLDTNSDIYDFSESLNDAAEQFINNNCKKIKSEETGLDSRCGNILINESFIAVKNSRSLDYYGGFEYVKEEDILHIGQYKVYLSDSERVQGHIDTWLKKP